MRARSIAAFSAPASTGDGWYSFDIAGVHVIALVNTLNLKKLGHLGVEQLEFVEKDVARLSNDTPIIVFSHIPLFAMYPDWGWGTDDAAQALSYLRRFASVTCLNGHVHQLFSKTEGNVTFYSGTTTAYPLPHPGDGPAPKPVTLPAGKLTRRAGHPRGELHARRPGTRIERTDAAMNLHYCAGWAWRCPWSYSAASHAYLYIHGYQHIPKIGTAFQIQASIFFALAVLILARRTRMAALGRCRRRRRLPGRLSSYPGRSDFSALPNSAGSHRLTPRSASSPRC